MLATELHKLCVDKPLPMVMLSSGFKEKSGNTEAHELFTAVLSKPLRPSQMLEVLTTLFAGGSRKIGSADLRSDIDKNLATRAPLRILLAEDNLVNQKVALRILERLGYRADVAGNGLEVLEALQRQSYCVVLMDVHMPEMDGIEATQEICRRWPKSQRPQVIAMTAKAMQGDREECLAAGMDDYMSKPIQIGVLQKVLERAAAQSDRLPNPSIVDPNVEITDSEKHIHRSVLDELRELQEDDEDDLVLKLIELYLGDVDARMQSIIDAYSQSDSKALEYAAHALKGSSANVGALRLVELCEEIERKAVRRIVNFEDDSLRQIKLEVTSVKAELEQEICLSQT
jgi:CheY-like chemotaxis protein/HPt (histidine-containing phosphotransfer) domain-containing protein